MGSWYKSVLHPQIWPRDAEALTEGRYNLRFPVPLSKRGKDKIPCHSPASLSLLWKYPCGCRFPGHKYPIPRRQKKRRQGNRFRLYSGKGGKQPEDPDGEQNKRKNLRHILKAHGFDQVMEGIEVKCFLPAFQIRQQRFGAGVFRKITGDFRLAQQAAQIISQNNFVCIKFA